MNILILISFLCCASTPQLTSEIIEKNLLIFEGEIVDVNTKNKRGHGSFIYSFKVNKNYKGTKKGDVVKIYSGMHSAGIHANIGEKWLINISQKIDRKYREGICGFSGNLENERIQKNIRKLKKHFSS